MMLEPPTGDQRVVWDIYLSSFILPAVAAADERGIFTLLDAGPRSTTEIAARSGMTEEWAEILLGVLAILRLVRVQDGRFHLTDEGRAFLLPDSPYYAGFTLGRFAQRNVYERLKQALDGASMGGERYVVRNWKPGELSLEVAQNGVKNMHGLSFAAAVGMARNGDFSGVRRLLDVAGGSGGFSIALAQQYPNLRCTVAELPIVCDLTQAYLVEYGVADRVDTTPLNMFFEPWPEGYDAVFMSCVLHDWDLEHRAELVRRSFEALPSGGRIYIHEMLLSDAADGPAGPALFSLSMRIGTLGKQFTAPELRAVLEAAGFTNVAVRNTHGYFSLMDARKP